MKNLKTFLLSLLLLSTAASGSLLIGSTENVGTEVLPDPSSHFQSDVVVYPEVRPTAPTMGSVPVEFQDYQSIRPIGLLFNLADDDGADTMGFTTSGGAFDLYYALPVPQGNNRTLHHPSWLTSGNGWAYSELSGTTLMPDALGIPGVDYVTVDVFYYVKTAHAGGSFTYAGYRDADWDQALASYVGWFLFPSSITIAAVNPPILPVIESISDPYSAPAMDSILWEPLAASETYPSPDATATSWADPGNFSADYLLENASCGDHIALTDATYTNKGTITITTGPSCDYTNPVYFHPQTQRGATLDENTNIKFSGIDGVVMSGFRMTATDQDADDFLRRIDIDSDSNYIAIMNMDFDNLESDPGNCPSSPCAAWAIITGGDYTVIANNDIDTDKNLLQSFNIGSGKNPQWPIVRDNDHFDRVVPGKSGRAGEDVQLGNSADSDDCLKAIKVWNRHYNWENPIEAELNGLKANCLFIGYDYMENARGNYASRSSQHYTIFATRNFNTTNKDNRNQMAIMHGSGNGQTNGVIALNWIDWFSSGNGWYNPESVGTGVDERWPGNKVLLVKNMIRTDTTVWRNSNTGTDPQPMDNIRVECNAVEVVGGHTGVLIDDNAHSMQSDWAFSGNVWRTVGATMGWTPPGGDDDILDADPVFELGDRSNVDLPTSASLDCDVNIAFPGWLPDSKTGSGEYEFIGARH